MKNLLTLLSLITISTITSNALLNKNINVKIPTSSLIDFFINNEKSMIVKLLILLIETLIIGLKMKLLLVI
ncbi:hypothetical protein SAP269_21460 (plasmid) [Spiroplasma ixodetis]|uniref:Spiroplasmavirus-related protein n=1 Tax=Spiroplasma ixodetis TaxID=2141 RepID=A0ABM8JRJ0_9MOLU